MSNPHDNFPVFDSPDCPADWSIEPFNRGVAIIQIEDQNQYVVYHRGDYLWRFPGGHVEEGEDYWQAAARETEEEVGVTGLRFQKYLGSTHKFLRYRGQPSHVIEHFAWCKIQIADWENKQEDEEGIYPALKTREEILQNGWNQIEYILQKLPQK
jgi:8-oxo-dGTP pyrophosphatase MutT (NUDIX family)